MAVSKEAKLILRLVDHVTKPAAAISESLSRVAALSKGIARIATAPARTVAGLGRHARRSANDLAGVSAGVTLAAAAAGKAVFEWEKLGNAIEAVGLLTDKQRDRLQKFSLSLVGKYPYTPNQIMEAGVETSKAGLNPVQIEGSLPSILDLAQAGDVTPGDAAAYAIRIATAMRLPLDTLEHTRSTMKRVTDAIAYGAAQSLASVESIGTTMSYVAPLAAAAGLSLEETTALTMDLAQAGIEGSKAGTGLRFMLLRLVSPSKQASKALQRLNIDLGDYITGARKITAKDVINQLALDGIDAKAFEKQIEGILSDPAMSKAPAKLVGRITELLANGLGMTSAIDREMIAQNLSDTLTVLGMKIDFRGFMKALRDNPQSEELMGQIFGARHAEKALALLVSDIDGTLSKMEREYVGAAQRMASTRMKGIVGDWYRLRGEIMKFSIMLSKTGVMESFTKGVRAATQFMTQLGKANPKVLEFGAYGLLAIAAIAPLGLAISGMAAALSLALNPLTWVAAGLGYIAAMNWDSIVGYLKGFGEGVRNNLGPNTRALIDNIKRSFLDLDDAIDKVDANAAGRRHAAGLMGFVEDTVTDWQHNVRETQEAIDNLKSAWASFVGWWDGVKARGREIADWFRWFESPESAAAMNRAITTFFKSVGATVKSAFLSFINSDMVEAFSTAGRVLYQKGADAIQSLLDGMISKFQELIAWARAIPGRIAGAVGSISLGGLFGGAPPSGPPATGDGSVPGPASNAASVGAAMGSLAGKRAGGGPVQRGLTYLVGEEGTELFTPDRSGTIVPNHALGGSVVNHNTFHIHGGNAEEIVRKMVSALERQLVRSRQVAMDGRPSYEY